MLQMQIFCLHPMFFLRCFLKFTIQFHFAADEMLLLLRLQLFAAVFVSVASRDFNAGAEEFYRVVIHEPVAKHHYLYHYEFCFLPQPVYSDYCWVVGDYRFFTHIKVDDYYIT